MPFSLLRKIALLTLVALGLILVLAGRPALATGPHVPPPRHHAHDPCVPRPAVPHSRASDVPLRGERPPPRPGCGAPHGALHRLFHGHRRH